MEVVFVVGLRGKKNSTDDDYSSSKADDALFDEINRFQDILQGDFVDSYDNLTLKTLLILKTMSEVEQCRRARYLLKCDIDVFINVPHLVAVIQYYSSLQRTILGFLTSNFAFRRGPYAVTIDEYPLDRYPPYAAGPLYVISNDLPPELFETSEYVPRFRMEDVYVTGILAIITGGVNLVNLPDLITVHYSEHPLTVCDVIANRITARSEITAVEKLSIWKEIEDNRTCVS